MLTDQFERPLESLRVSVTDRCNLRCRYCMPEEEYAWIPRADILTFEEITRLADVFIALGAGRIRLTGGEPLLRHDLPLLVRMLAGRPGLRDLALTTNGVLLESLAAPLADAGLHRITVSLDTLRPERFTDLAQSDALGRVLRGIEVARRAALPLKINAVVLRGVNEDESADLVEFGRRIGAEVRFIEYMDVGGATRWSAEQVVSRDEILDRITSRLGRATPVPAPGHAPADRYALPDGTTFGVIASTTAPFCRSCDRSRLTADGQWFLCLYAVRGLDLRALLRAGAPTAEIQQAIATAWRTRADRGAEERLALRQRGPFVSLEALRRDPRLEMHARGG